MKELCQDCKFAKSTPNSAFGTYTCRLLPPDLRGKRPIVKNNDWCGEWQSRVVLDPKPKVYKSKFHSDTVELRQAKARMGIEPSKEILPHHVETAEQHMSHIWLENLAQFFDDWREFQKKIRDEAGAKTDDLTNSLLPPEELTHGDLKQWSKVLREAVEQLR